MLELALVVYAAVALFFLWMARSENRRKGQSDTLLTYLLSLGWPVLLVIVAVYLIGAARAKPAERPEAPRPLQLKTQKSS